MNIDKAKTKACKADKPTLREDVKSVNVVSLKDLTALAASS